jgi:AcrR family transcriptional regulator
MVQKMKGHSYTGLDPAEKELTQAPDTRERILDIALDLFTSQGYEKTSLREIAEQLGFSKAAIYYHFASKEAILMALHMRLHDVGLNAFVKLGQQTMTLDRWSQLLDEMIDQMLTHRQLFILHERNRTAFEGLHDEQHAAEHDDFESMFRNALANEDIPMMDRLRVASAFGAVMIALLMSGNAFESIPVTELGDMLREIAHGILLPTSAT